MKIYTEDFVIEIKARMSWEKRNNSQALASILTSWKLGEFEAAKAYRKNNEHEMAEYHNSTYKALAEAIKELER